MMSKLEFIKDWEERMGPMVPLSESSVIDYVASREKSLRAQADAGPVAVPRTMVAYNGYVPPEDGDAGEYYVRGWNDCIAEVKKFYPSAPAAQGLSDEKIDAMIKARLGNCTSGLRADAIALVEDVISAINARYTRRQALDEIVAESERIGGYDEPAATVDEPSNEEWKDFDSTTAQMRKATQQQAEPVGDEREPEAPFDFHHALQIAKGVMEQYKADMPKWWKRMDGTPILTDLPVIMALAFQGKCEALQERAIKAEELNRNFMDSVNGPAHMGEPVMDDGLVLTDKHRWAIGMHINALEESGHQEAADRWRNVVEAVPKAGDETPMAKPISDEMMDVVDRLGSEADSVDSRVWDHLLIYAPHEKIAARAAQSGQRAGVPQHWLAKREEDGWIRFCRPDGWRQSITPHEPANSHAHTLYLLLDGLIAAAPTQQQEQSE